MNRTNRHIFVLLLALAGMWACANRGVGPQGGPKDETPPKMVKEVPANGTVNYHDNRIEITFDEYLQLNDVVNQVLISPPQQRPPEVRAYGKKLTVTFDGELRDSTTYTIDFGAAICDNNERNPLQGYTFAFATGPEIDTLQMSGIVINAENLNPVANIYAGIHQNLADSAFEKEPFTRIARTNDKGEFTIQNIHRGIYRLYALDDISRDYLYQPGEGLAMHDSLFAPTVRHEGRIDTIFVADTLVAKMDSLQLDSLPHDTLGHYWERIESKTVPVFEPKDILLMYFKEDKLRHYFVRCLRDDPNYFKLLFSAPQDRMPVIRALNQVDTLQTDSLPLPADSLVNDSIQRTVPDSIATDSIVAEAIAADSIATDSIVWTDYAVFQPSTNKDTITVWLTDSMIISRDTIAFTMTYMASDSILNLYPQTDTVLAVYRAPRLSEKVKAAMDKKKENEVKRLNVRHNASSSFDIYDSLRINSPTPLRYVDLEKIHLSLKKDTTYKPLKISPFVVDSSKMQIVVPYKWEPEKEYLLEIDSAAFTDVYNASNDQLESTMRVRSLEDYSTLIVKMEDIDYRARIQLLNEKDAVVRELPVSDEGARFEFLKPTSYYMRLYLDLNGDGKWTTGDWMKHRAPEPVFYFSGKLTLRANWDFEETFNIHAKPLLEQKPAELKTAEGNKKK